MRLVSWLLAAALISGLTVGCEEDEGDDGDGAISDGGGSTQNAAQDAATTASGGTGGNAANPGTPNPPRCTGLPNLLKHDILNGFGNINSQVCDLCFDTSSCAAAPFSGSAIDCFMDVVCRTPHLHRPAQWLSAALASEHGLCNYEGKEKSCGNDCYSQTLGKAVPRCNDPNLGAALAKCGFNFM